MPGTSDSLTLDRIVLNTCESIFSSLRGTASTFRCKFSRLIPGATVSHVAVKLSPLLQRIQTPLFREDMCCSLRLPGDRHTQLKVFWRFKPNQDTSNDLILVVCPHMTPFNPPCLCKWKRKRLFIRSQLKFVSLEVPSITREHKNWSLMYIFSCTYQK